MDTLNAETYEKYAEKWIAVDSATNIILAVGKDIVEVEKKLPKKQKNIVVSFVNPLDKYLSF